MRMIILAAGQGTRLRPLTNDRPKCLVEVCGRPMLAWQIEAAREAGIDDIVVLGGYRADQLRSYGVKVIENSDYATTNMVRTLFCAEAQFGDGFVMSYGDIIYRADLLKKLLAAHHSIGVVVDLGWRSYWQDRFADPLSDAESLAIDESGRITDIGRRVTSYDEVMAQYIGLVGFRADGVDVLRKAYASASAAEAAGQRPFGSPRSLDQLYMTDLLQGLIAAGESVHAITVNRGWAEVDSMSDIEVAERIFCAGKAGGAT